MKKIMAKIKCVGCETRDTHQAPWITAPFRMNFISSLSLWLVISKDFLHHQSHCPQKYSVDTCRNTSLSHLGGANLLLWETS